MSIREEISKLVFKENEFLKEDEASSSSRLKFKSFKPKSEIFKAVLADLYKKRDANGIFYNNDEERRAGYLSDVYGCTAVLSLANDGSVTLNKEQKDILVKNIKYILKEISEYGFTLYPYISGIDNQFVWEKNNETMFNSTYPYIGALTWTISFLTSVKKAAKKENEEVNKEENRYLEIEPSLMNDVNRLIVRIVDYFNTSVIKTSDPNNPEKTNYLGWSYTRDCLEPSLFFTYSVLEAFSDFEDNILDLVMDENGYVIKDGNMVRKYKDSESDLKEMFATKAGKDGVEQWAEACSSVAQNIWRVYGKVLNKDFVDDKFLEGFGVITLEDIMKMDHTNALFNNVFLVSSLMYGWVNVLNPYETKEIVSTMEIALQNVQRAIDALNRKNMEYVVETYTIPFTNLHNKFRDTYVRKLNYRRIGDTTLLPMLIKANNMIAVYITKYPVKKMDELYEQIFDDSNICDTEVLWDDKGYDVKITERYIEAISQFYSYYVAYEEDYTIGFQNAKAEGFKEGRREGVAYQRAKNKEDLAQKDIEREEAVRKAREEYSIENALMERMGQFVEKKILEALANVSEKVAKHNWNSKKQKELVTYDDRLEASILDIIESYISSKVRAFKQLEGRDMTSEELAKYFEQDLKLLIEKQLEGEKE